MNEQETTHSASPFEDFAFIYQQTAAYLDYLGFLGDGEGKFSSPLHHLKVSLEKAVAPRLHISIRVTYSAYPGENTGNVALVEKYQDQLEAWAEEMGFEVSLARSQATHPPQSARLDVSLEYRVWPVLH